MYLMSSVGGHIYILFTIPLLTHYLSKEEFGLYIILTQIVVVVQSALLVFFSNGLLKFWVDTPDDDRQLFMGTIFTSFVSVALLTTIALYLFRDIFFDILFPNVTTDITIILLYTVLWLTFISFRSFLLSFIKALEKPKFILVHIITYGVLLVGLLYWQLALRSGSLVDVMLAIFLAETLALTLLVYPSLKNLTISFNFSYLISFMKFSLPLTGASLAFIVFQNIDRIILARYESIENMGVYGIGFMFGSTAGIIVTANMSAYLPRVKKVMRSRNVEEVKRLTTHYMQEIQDLMLIVVFIVALFNELIVYQFANSYNSTLASIVMVGVATGHLARSNYLFYKQILILKDNVKQIFLNEMTTLIIGLVVSYLLVRYLGLLGASIGMAITYLIMNFIAYKTVRKYSLIETNFKMSVCRGLCIVLLLVIMFIFESKVIYLKILECFALIICVILFYKKYLKGVRFEGINKIYNS